VGAGQEPGDVSGRGAGPAARPLVAPTGEHQAVGAPRVGVVRSGYDLARHQWRAARGDPVLVPVAGHASRELARRRVDAALEADAKPNGMIVSCEGKKGASLQLAEARRTYLVGSKKGADLRITDAELPSRALELRRQADQLWVTLLANMDATLGDRELALGERTAWPKAATLSIGGARLVTTDPTARVLEQLEQGRTERLADDATIEPPRRSDGDEDADADDAEAEDDDAESSRDWSDAEDDAELAPAVAAPLAGSAAPRAGTARSGWSRADAIVFFLAIGVLALSLWAIRWLSQLGSA